jgi:ABC-type nitrate/sulfonate/bicarbonate transport system permease component
MRGLLRFLLRVAALLLLAGAVYLVVLAPKATVASVGLGTNLNVQVQCSSVWDQETHHAQPATLAIGGHSLTSLPAAQSSCQSASRTIKEVVAGLTAGAVVAFGLSFLFRRSRRF